MSKDRQKRPAEKDDEAAMDDRTGENKTEFFRQPQAWQVLEEKVIVPLVERAEPGGEIRVWVPGCSTGKEAYSLAMALVEEVEASGKKLTVQIFATDSDVASLATARERRLFEGRDGGEHLGQAVEAVFYAPGRPLPEREGVTGADRFRSAEHHGGPALFEARPDQLPQLPDLPGPGNAEEDHRPLSFCAEGGGISVSGHCRDGGRPGRSLRGCVEEMADLSAHRRRSCRGSRDPPHRGHTNPRRPAEDGPSRPLLPE